MLDNKGSHTIGFLELGHCGRRKCGDSVHDGGTQLDMSGSKAEKRRNSGENELVGKSPFLREIRSRSSLTDEALTGPREALVKVDRRHVTEDVDQHGHG